MIRAVAVIAVAVAAAAGPAAAGPIRVFPLAAAAHGDRGAPAAMTTALAGALDAEISAVTLDDAAGVLGCDVGDADCLDAIARSIGATDLVFGAVAPAAGGARVVLARHTAGAASRRATFTVTGASADALATALVAAAGDFLDVAAPVTVIDETDADADPQPVAITGPVVPAPSPRRTPRYVWGVIAGGAVVAAIGGGFLISARGLRDDVGAAPTTSRDDIDKLIELEDTGRSRSRLGAALVVAGGLAIATGVVLAIVHPHHRDGDRTTPTPTVALEPALVPGGAMVMLRIGAP